MVALKAAITSFAVYTDFPLSVRKLTCSILFFSIFQENSQKNNIYPLYFNPHAILAEERHEIRHGMPGCLLKISCISASSAPRTASAVLSRRQTSRSGLMRSSSAFPRPPRETMLPMLYPLFFLQHPESGLETVTS